MTAYVPTNVPARALISQLPRDEITNWPPGGSLLSPQWGLAGTLIGAAAVSGLHAQTKPPVFLITEIDVTNPEAYGKEFAPKAQATIKAAGARFLLIGGAAGAGAKPITAIAGTPPKRVTVQVWESLEAMNKWYNGADYQAALKIGDKYATFRRYAVEGQ